MSAPTTPRPATCCGPATLPRGSEGIPAMYQINGRQYLVVCATTGLTWGKASREGGPWTQADGEPNGPSAYVVFALPERAPRRPRRRPRDTRTFPMAIPAVTRRTFTRSLALGAAAAALPGGALQAQAGKRLKVGHTGITWGFKPTDAEQAIKDVGSLGFHGYESFGNVLESWDKQGGLNGCSTPPSCRCARPTAR